MRRTTSSTLPVCLRPPARRSRLRTALATVAAVVLAAATITVAAGSVQPAMALDNGLARTPIMGWNSWNQVRCYDLTEAVVTQAADNLVSRGLHTAGYNYVVVDDCWQGGRDASGTLFSDPNRFPSGMAALAAYVHDKGLKFGLYAVPGSETCANYWDAYPVTGIGSHNHEAHDAATFASWGVDYLKYDWCRADVTDGLQHQAAFTLMRDELAKQNRPIVYAISEYGDTQPWTWAAPIANQWRTTSDINPSWSSIAGIIESQAALAQYAKPGAWNDPDMLQVGNGSLTHDENVSHIAMWSMLAAPLFLGTNIANLSDDLANILTNPELVAINQDSLGRQATRIANDSGRQVWTRPLADGGRAVALYNWAGTAQTISTSLSALGASPGTYALRDVINRTDAGSTSGPISATVPAHGTVIFRLAPGSGPRGSTFVSDQPIASSSVGWGSLQIDKSVDGNTLTNNGTTYARGLGAHATSAVTINLQARCSSLTGALAIDDEAGPGDATYGAPSITGSIEGDGRGLWATSGTIGYRGKQEFTVNVTGVTWLTLRADAGATNAYDHADWLTMALTCQT